MEEASSTPPLLLSQTVGQPNLGRAGVISVMK